MHGGRKYFVKDVVGEAGVDQSNRSLLFLIRRGDPSVWTFATSTSTPGQLHGKEGRDVR